jgi:hypothetical protein
VIVVALLAIHGLFLIIIGLLAFFGGFVGAYDVSNGHATPGAIVAVLGAFLAWIFLLGGIVSCLCAQGLLTWQRWAFWLTLALKVSNLIVGGCTLLLRLFAPWPIALSMSVAGGILLTSSGPSCETPHATVSAYAHSQLAADADTGLHPCLHQ